MRSLISGGTVRLWLALLLAFATGALGCRRRGAAPEATEPAPSTTAEAPAVEPGPPPADWPRILVTTPGSGPALYLGHERDAPAVGYLGPGVRVRMETAPLNDRVEVLVAGRLATKGWVPVERLGAYAQRRGRVEGTRAYLGPNDLVGVRGPEGEGQMGVSVRPWLGGDRFLGPFEGTFATEQLADQPVEGDVEGVTPGDCYQLPAGQPLPVYERPGGDVVATLPATDPPLAVVVLRERDGWYGARIGYGPYLTGYLQGALTACDALPEPEPMMPEGQGERPYWMSQEQGALHRVAEGTPIGFHGRTIARLRDQGWARELARQDNGLVDVFLAADDGAAIRGLVRENALTLVEGEPSAAPEPEPEEELPPELQ